MSGSRYLVEFSATFLLGACPRAGHLSPATVFCGIAGNASAVLSGGANGTSFSAHLNACACAGGARVTCAGACR